MSPTRAREAGQERCWTPPTSLTPCGFLKPSSRIAELARYNAGPLTTRRTFRWPGGALRRRKAVPHDRTPHPQHHPGHRRRRRHGAVLSTSHRCWTTTAPTGIIQLPWPTRNAQPALRPPRARRRRCASLRGPGTAYRWTDDGDTSVCTDHRTGRAPWWWPAKGCTVTKPHATRWPDGTPQHRQRLCVARAPGRRHRQHHRGRLHPLHRLHNAWRSDQRSGHGKGAHMTWAQYRATQTPKTKSFAHRDPGGQKTALVRMAARCSACPTRPTRCSRPRASCCQIKVHALQQDRCCHRAPCAGAAGGKKVAA